MRKFPALLSPPFAVLLALSLVAARVAGDERADDPPAPSASPGTKRLVYACREGTTPVFSDRPCGVRMEPRRLDLPLPNAAGAVPSTREAPPAAATRPIAAPAPRRDAPVPADRCARLTEQLAAIDARMRHGYSARESARLWQRWRDVKARLHAARC